MQVRGGTPGILTQLDTPTSAAHAGIQHKQENQKDQTFEGCGMVYFFDLL